MEQTVALSGSQLVTHPHLDCLFFPASLPLPSFLLPRIVLPKNTIAYNLCFLDNLG